MTLILMSDVGIAAIATSITAVLVAFVSSLFAYLMKRLEKVGVKVDAVAVEVTKTAVTVGEVAIQAEEAKVAAKETSVKQDGMIKQQDEIHTVTNGKLSAVQEELKTSKQSFIDELKEYKSEVKGLRAAILEMAKQSIPQGSAVPAPIAGTVSVPMKVEVVPTNDPLPVKVVEVVE